MRIGGMNSFILRARPIAVFGLLLAAAANPGCSCEDTVPTGPGGSGGGGTAGQGGEAGQGGDTLGACESVTVTQIANGDEFARPFDATPDSTAGIVYFTALNDEGESSIFQVQVADPPALATAAAVFEGPPLVAPFGLALSGDGATLYIADPGADEDTTDADGYKGEIWTLDTSGGNPQNVTQAQGYRARGIEVANDGNDDVVYFTGNDPATGIPGVFSMPAGGGTITTLVNGGGLVDPSGIAVNAAGIAYVGDSIGGEGGVATIFEVSDAAVPLVTDLKVGYPVGVSLDGNETHLFVSGIDPLTGFDVLYSIDLSDNAVTQFDAGLEDLNEAAGLHRARNVNTFAFADANADASGAVYLLECE
jgi:hypothetical protein